MHLYIPQTSNRKQRKMHEDAPVIIVGAGPIGMLLAYQLDRLDIPCLIAEQNLETTKWPKMDLTNCRSMEILRILGLADDYRAQPGSVPQTERFDTQFVTQINHGGRLLHTWKLPSTAKQRHHARIVNDGSQTAEPEQRCSQIVFEAWMKDVLSKRAKVTTKFGWKYKTHVEGERIVKAEFIDLNGNTHIVHGRYLVGCDGGGSRVRRTTGIKMQGGPMPMRFHLVHFKSKELSENLPFGRFWHIFAANGGFIIDQDHKHTFTAHFPVNLLKSDETDPREIVYGVLGGAVGEKYRIKIDEILVDSEWTPNFSIADQYQTDNLRVFLAGDAAHRSPPHGGYGMNSGIIDAIDLSWRLAAMIKGYGGDLLLKSYTIERRPPMIRAIVRTYRHIFEHVKLAQISASRLHHLDASTPEGEALRQEIDTFLRESGTETRDQGIEFDIRHYHSPIVYQDQSDEVKWEIGCYTPNTRPGSRAPHAFLDDRGDTSIYDLFGTGFTLVQFVYDTESEKGQNIERTMCLENGAQQVISDSPQEKLKDEENPFVSTALARGIPLKHVQIRNQPHVHRIWERELVLVRPDTHIAWRGSCSEVSRLGKDGVCRIWDIVTGHVTSPFAEKFPAAHVENEQAFERIVTELLGVELRGREELGIQY